VPDTGAAYLESFPGLRILRLGWTRITDRSLSSLGRLTKLQELDLEANRITDAGLKQLVGLSELRELNVGMTQVTQAGCAALQLALPDCEIRL